MFKFRPKPHECSACKAIAEHEAVYRGELAEQIAELKQIRIQLQAIRGEQQRNHRETAKIVTRGTKDVRA